MDEREAVNRSIADHLARLRERLDAGQAEIERQRAAIDETHEHLAGMSRWIDETNLHLADERGRWRGWRDARHDDGDEAA